MQTLTQEDDFSDYNMEDERKMLLVQEAYFSLDV